MKSPKKIKLFLGAYVNFPNAQNINCDNIARYIDKDKFEVHTMYSDKLPIDKEKYKALGVRLHRLIHHRFIWYWCKLFTMLFGNYDVYYLPKMEQADRHLARLLRRKRATAASVEGVVTDSINNSDEFRQYYTETMTSYFAISECIADSIRRQWGQAPEVIPLGVKAVNGQYSPRNQVSKVLWVGNIKANKRPLLLIECAKAFPELSFEMLGDGDMMDEVKKLISQYSLSNVKLFGRVPNEQVYEHLSSADLLLMTSEYEGLPKVIQEAAVCFVPSIYIGEHYTVDFIEDGVNGYKVLSLDEMKEKIRYLLDNPSEFQAMSKAANELIQPYLWPTLIKEYEDYFIKIYAEKTERV